LTRLWCSPGTPQEPIRIELAEGPVVDGIVIRNGRPVRAFVYAVPDDIELKSDFRAFQPLISDADGKFHIEGLVSAPSLHSVRQPD
jgi:hypothetical protein